MRNTQVRAAVESRPLDITTLGGVAVADIPEPLQSALRACFERLPTIDAVLADPLAMALLQRFAEWRAEQQQAVVR